MSIVKSLKIVSFTIIPTILGIILIILIIIFCGKFAEYFGIISNPKRLLNTYVIGENRNNINISINEIYTEIKGPKGINDISIKGYSKPNYILDNNQYLVILDKGDYMIYLYFNNKDVLIHKEALGS